MPKGTPNTTPTPCRECHEIVPGDALTCPHCGAPRPARQNFAGEGYEWKTQATWMGSPLVHIAFGLDATGRARTARGVIAIGQRAVGGVAIGVVAFGFCAIGLVSVGLFSAGVVAVAALAACGLNAAAPFACGLVAFGYKVRALAPLGWLIGR